MGATYNDQNTSAVLANVNKFNVSILCEIKIKQKLVVHDIVIHISNSEHEGTVNNPITVHVYAFIRIIEQYYCARLTLLNI